tara:strand:+ start:700 stop:1608 length:909 start_codon:yes stop_codon:yes gene_type:complete
VAGGQRPFYCWPLEAGNSLSIVVAHPAGARGRIIFPNPIPGQQVGTYYPRNQVADDCLINGLLLGMLRQAMPGSNVGVTWYQNTGRLRIAANVSFSLHADKFPQGAWKIDPAEFGLGRWRHTSNRNAANGKHEIVTPYPVRRVWMPEQFLPYDSEDYPVGRSSGVVAMDGVTTRAIQWGQRTQRETRHDVLPASKIFQAEETSVGGSLEAFFDWYSTGSKFEFWPNRDNVDEGVGITRPHRYVMRGTSRNAWPAVTMTPTHRLFEVSFDMLRVEVGTTSDATIDKHLPNPLVLDPALANRRA